MDMLNKVKKGQSLPLNTIVIAILVIIVLLIIVVFFASNMGKQGEQLNSLSGCDASNGAIAALGYKTAEAIEVDKDKVECSASNQERISIIPSKAVDGNDQKVMICCGSK